MTFQVGDYVCSKRDDPTKSWNRIYQIVKIEFYPGPGGGTFGGGASVECYGILDYSCNPAPRWGSFSMGCRLEQLAHVSELLVLARAGRGEHATGRPQHYVDKDVWTKEAYELAVSGS